jgi:hypothetical protein
MKIPPRECHFGYFGLAELREAYKILLTIKDTDIIYDSGGKIIN